MSQESFRARNRRGQGARLRDDILDAAALLLEQRGSEQDITLRAVARQVGIAAPSIYAHFADREAIVAAVVDQVFAELNASVVRAIASRRAPRTRLRAGCAAYLHFAVEQPSRFRLLFERADILDADRPRGLLTYARTDSYRLLVESLQACIDAGVSTSRDAPGDATAIWIALHGYASLRPALPDFPWTSADSILDRILTGLGGIVKTRHRR